MTDFEGHLTALESDIQTHLASDSTLIVAGDFNAKSPTWASSYLDARGIILENFADLLEL